MLILLFTVQNTTAIQRVRITNGEWAPYLSEYLPDHGFASHVVREAFARAGIEVVYGFFPWKRSFQLAAKGIWDGSVVWVPTRARKTDFFFSKTVVRDNEYLFHLNHLDLNWHKIEDLEGLTIGGTLHTV